jgi:hypothetical protein
MVTWARPIPACVAALVDPVDETALMRAVADARLLVPIVVSPTELDDAVDSIDLVVGKSTDMAVLTLTSPDGQRAFPVFSSIAALSAWDATARPSPVSSSRAAQTAVFERCEVMVLDLGSGQEYVLRPSMVWALAQQRDWLPAHTDPFVAQALSRATADEEDVVDCVGEGDRGWSRHPPCRVEPALGPRRRPGAGLGYSYRAAHRY